MALFALTFKRYFVSVLKYLQDPIPLLSIWWTIFPCQPVNGFFTYYFVAPAFSSPPERPKTTGLKKSDKQKTRISTRLKAIGGL